MFHNKGLNWEVFVSHTFPAVALAKECRKMDAASCRECHGGSDSLYKASRYIHIRFQYEEYVLLLLVISIAAGDSYLPKPPFLSFHYPLSDIHKHCCECQHIKNLNHLYLIFHKQDINLQVISNLIYYSTQQTTKMPINFQKILLPLRIAQAVLAIIVLGLTAYVINAWSGSLYGYHWSPSQADFLLFCSIWSKSLALLISLVLEHSLIPSKPSSQ